MNAWIVQVIDDRQPCLLLLTLTQAPPCMVFRVFGSSGSPRDVKLSDPSTAILTEKTAVAFNVLATANPYTLLHGSE